MTKLSNTEKAWLTAEHELRATKQELQDLRQIGSDMAEAYIKHAFTVQEKHLTGYKVTVAFENHDDAIAWFDQLLFLPELIIPAPEPDPLVEVIEAWFNDFRQEVSDAASFRTALEAYGLEIRKKNDG